MVSEQQNNNLSINSSMNKTVQEMPSVRLGKPFNSKKKARELKFLYETVGVNFGGINGPNSAPWNNRFNA